MVDILVAFLELPIIGSSRNATRISTIASCASYIGQDITDLVNMQRELQQSRDELVQTVFERTKQLHQALQVKSNFLATMSHGVLILRLSNCIEIRTPIAGILSSLALLSEFKLRSDQKELLDIAQGRK